MLLYLHSVSNNHQHMPRQERTKSGTGIYHVMLRGINKQDIFEDDEERSGDGSMIIIVTCQTMELRRL